MRVVFDTNVVVSALVWRGRLAILRKAWESGRVIPLVSVASFEELSVVLRKSKFGLDGERREELLSYFWGWCRVVEVERGREDWGCRDVDDVVFLDLAGAGGVGVLVCGDLVLLVLDGRLRAAVVPSARGFGRD